MTVREPEWTPRDRALALAWQQEQHFTCSGCGVNRAESTAKENQGAWKVDVFYCHACSALQAAQQTNRDDNKGPSHGLYFNLKRRGTT